MGAAFSHTGPGANPVQAEQPAPGDVVPEPTGKRTLNLTLVGGYVYLNGILAALGAILILAAGSSRGGTVVSALVLLCAAGLNVFAGSRLLHRDERGRILGIVLAAFGVLGSLVILASGGGAGLFSGAIEGYILWYLLTTDDLVRR